MQIGIGWLLQAAVRIAIATVTLRAGQSASSGKQVRRSFVSNRGQARSDSAGLTGASRCLSATTLAAKGAERIHGRP
jgi:hypothetical protein